MEKYEIIPFNLYDYEIGEKLGKGNFGQVFSAFNKKEKKKFALKQIFKKTLKILEERAGRKLNISEEKIKEKQEKQYKEIIREASFLSEVSRSNCPHLVQLKGFTQTEDSYYFLLEFIENDSLSKIIKKYNQKNPKKSMDQSLILNIFSQILDGLMYLHQTLNIIHRDIKPDNILMDKNWQVKISDFGLSAFSQEADEDVPESLKVHGTKVGDFCWFCPEIERGEKYDKRADIYSLGLICFNMMTFRKPFRVIGEKKIRREKNEGIKINEKFYDKELVQLVYDMMEEHQVKRPDTEKVYQRLNEIKKRIKPMDPVKFRDELNNLFEKNNYRRYNTDNNIKFDEKYGNYFETPNKKNDINSTKEIPLNNYMNNVNINQNKNKGENKNYHYESGKKLNENNKSNYTNNNNGYDYSFVDHYHLIEEEDQNSYDIQKNKNSKITINKDLVPPNKKIDEITPKNNIITKDSNKIGYIDEFDDDENGEKHYVNISPDEENDEKKIASDSKINQSNKTENLINHNQQIFPGVKDIDNPYCTSSIINKNGFPDSNEFENITLLDCILNVLINCPKIKQYFTKREVVEKVRDIDPEKIVITNSIISFFNLICKEINWESKEKEAIEAKIKEGLLHFKEKVSSFIDFNEKEGNIQMTPNEFLIQLFLLTKQDQNELNLIDPNYVNSTLLNLEELKSLPKNKFPKVYEKIQNFSSKYRTILTENFYFLVLNKEICKRCGETLPENTECSTCNFFKFYIKKGMTSVKVLLKDTIKKRPCQNPYSFCHFCNSDSKYLETQLKLFNSPNILMFHFCEEGTQYGEIVCPEEELDLTEFKESNIGPYKYGLFALIYKEKENSGKSGQEYVLFIRSLKNKFWKKYSFGKTQNWSYEDIVKYYRCPCDVFYRGRK